MSLNQFLMMVTVVVGLPVITLLWFRVTALENGNYVISSSFETIGGSAWRGSVILVNGTTGDQIGAKITGSDPGAGFGQHVYDLKNGNFVVLSVGGTGGASGSGFALIINATTGAQVGSTFSGDDSGDYIGESGVAVLSNGNFVIASKNTNCVSISLMLFTYDYIYTI